jgi:lipopolysaccharide transport system ATP-binding protein
MGEVGKEGRTVLVVSHNMPIVTNLCQRAILLEKGGLVVDGHSAHVVQKYLDVVRLQSREGEVVWPDPTTAPGNDIVRLQSVRILQEGLNEATADVDIAKEIRVEITYRCFKEGELLYAALWLKDGMGTRILSTGNLASISLTPDTWCGRPTQKGVFRSICKIPANFLNGIAYKISPAVGRYPSETLAFEEDAVSFQVHDTGEMRKEYLGYWLGVVRPKLAWQTERIE